MESTNNGRLGRRGLRIAAAALALSLAGVMLASEGRGQGTNASDEQQFATGALEWSNDKPAPAAGSSGACADVTGFPAPPAYGGTEELHQLAHTLLSVGWQAQVDSLCLVDAAAEASVAERGGALISLSSAVLAQADGIRLLQQPTWAVAESIVDTWQDRESHPDAVRGPVLDWGDALHAAARPGFPPRR